MRTSIAQPLVLVCLVSGSAWASDKPKLKFSQLLGVPDGPALGSLRREARPKADPFKPSTAATQLRTSRNVIAPNLKAGTKTKAKDGAPKTLEPLDRGAPPSSEALDLKAALPDPVRRTLAPLVTEEQRVTLLEASLRRPFDAPQRVENKAKAPTSLAELRDPDSSAPAENTVDATPLPVASPALEYLLPGGPSQAHLDSGDRMPSASVSKPRDPGGIWRYHNTGERGELTLRIQPDNDWDQNETCVEARTDPGHRTLLWPDRQSTFKVAKDDVIEVWIQDKAYSRQCQLVDDDGKPVTTVHLPLPRPEANQAPVKAPAPMPEN